MEFVNNPPSLPGTAPLKILFLSHKFYPDIGGIEVNSEILANYFSGFGAEVHLVTWTADKNKKTYPFKVIRNPNIFNLLKEHKWADVVFENNPSLRLSWPVCITQKKHVIAVRTWINRPDGSVDFQDILKLKWLRNANAVIAISQEVKKATFSKSIVIGNPFRDNLFREINKNKDRDFVFLGRLVSDKGADMAINLLKMLNAERNNGCEHLTLTIIGDGPERNYLEKMVHEFSLNGLVHFTGYLGGETLVKCLNRHKYLLVPSRWREPFGNIALEGMACGCLPIVSDGGGLPDAVGNAGVVFERNNIASLYEKVKDVLENPILELGLRNNFANHLKAHTSRVISKQYFELIKDCFPRNGRN